MELNDRIRQLPAYGRLTPNGVSYVENALIADPARFVGRSSLSSVSGAYASERFPHLSEYESVSCEKVFVLEAILDSSILDLRAQPPRIFKVSTNSAGKKRTVEATPDYLVFGLEAITLVECKRLAKLNELVATSPDWNQAEDGKFVHGPGVEAARKLGLSFSVYCPDQIPAAYRANLQLLARLPRDDLLASHPGTLRLIKKRLSDRPHSVIELCSEYETVTGAWLYQAILRGELFGLIKRQHLGTNFLIYGTKEEAEDYESRFRYTTADSEFGPLHTRLLRASANELALAAKAQQRFYNRRAQGLAMNATDYRDAKSMRLAEAEQAPQLAAFVRRVADRGGKGNPLPTLIVEEISKHAVGYLSDGRHPAKTKMYADCKVHLEALGLPVPSRETHRQLVNRELGPEKAAFLAGGKRAMHAIRARTDGANSNPYLRISGLRVHLDGVYGDIKAENKHESLFERPIFYPLVDDASGFILGRGVKVGAPGSVAALMAYRDCYLRHGFLPAQVVSDWGSEFVNHAIREASGFFGVGYERRPPGAPRFGAMGEMFNAQISSFLQGLSGGMYFDKLGRSADAKKKSAANASMSIDQIIDCADQWMFSVWNKTPIGSNERTPEEMWNESIRCFSEAVVEVEDSILARYFTSLPLKAKSISAHRGFRYGVNSYAAEELPGMLDRGEQPIGPRLDCTDPSIIHVMTRRGPISLRSLDYQCCQGLSESQLLAAMRDLYFSRSIAANNQEARNVKEALLRRDVDGARKTAPSPLQDPPPTPRNAVETLLSKVSREDIQALPVLKAHVRIARS